MDTRLARDAIEHAKRMLIDLNREEPHPYQEDITLAARYAARSTIRAMAIRMEGEHDEQ